MKKKICIILAVILMLNFNFATAEPVIRGANAPYVKGLYTSYSFGKIENYNPLETLEYGFLYSKDSEKPTMDTKDVRVLASKKPLSQNGYYGMEIIDYKRVLGDKYYVRPYVVIKDNPVKIIYSENVTFVDINKILADNSKDDGSYLWDDEDENYGLNYPFTPSDNYITEKNPPSFTWQMIDDVKSYDIRIANDRDMKDIAYECRDIKTNYHNFPYRFEKGKTYYWQVRYYKNDGHSRWSDKRRFVISKNAKDNPVLLIDDMLKKIPLTHPKMEIRDVEEFKSFKDKTDTYRLSKNLIDEIIAGNRSIPKEPTKYDDYERAISDITNYIERGAFVYIVSSDIKYGNVAKEALLSLAKWDYLSENSGSSYELQDQYFRTILKALSMGYDRLYNLLSEDEKNIVLSSVQGRMKILEHPTKGLVGDSIINFKKHPYSSHGWTALEFILLTSFATYKEIPESEEFIKKYLPIYINLFPVWGREDGSWAQGTDYEKVSYSSFQCLKYTLKIHNIIDLYDTPYMKNAINYMIANFGKYCGSEFGDGSLGIADGFVAYNLYVMAGLSNVGEAVWLKDKLRIGSVGPLDIYYVLPLANKIIPKTPDVKNSMYFKDVGQVALHSDLFDYDNRISMYFKSSPYGSYNHSHADQNSFVIQGFGERMAIDSGYYDYYGSYHHFNYTKKSIAHNLITYNGGMGQQGFNLRNAEGKITDFITSNNIDIVSGDATKAYNIDNNGNKVNNLKKAKRYIIYLKPDKFITIDDLQSYGDTKKTFEYLLHSEDNIELTGNNKAVINKTKGKLNADIIYPEKITAKKVEGFVDEKGSYWNPVGQYKDAKRHNRVEFQTENLNNTLIVSLLNVTRKDAPKEEYSVFNSDNFIKISFKDNTEVYINKNRIPVKTAEYETDGFIFIKDNNSLSVVDGTYLLKNDKGILKSDNKISFTLADNEIKLSSENEATVTLKGNNLNIEDIYDGVKIINSDFTTINIIPGQFEIKLNLNNLQRFNIMKNDEIKKAPVTSYYID